MHFDWAVARRAAVQFARKFPYLDADDVAQEAMLTLLTGRSSADGPLAVRAVVHRRGVDMLRRELGRDGRVAVELDARFVDQAPTPEHVMGIEDQLRAALRTTDTVKGRKPYTPSAKTAERHARLIERVYVLGEKSGAVAKDEGISTAELSRIVSAAKKRRKHVKAG